jgi:hypothetical protein
MGAGAEGPFKYKISLGKKLNNRGIEERPRGMGPDIDAAGFVERAKQH